MRVASQASASGSNGLGKVASTRSGSCGPSIGPALILLDLMMPILDGWTFCKVRQGVSMLMDIPVVAISAASMSGKHEPLRVEATLPKPFDPDALAWLATRMAKRKASVPPRH